MKTKITLKRIKQLKADGYEWVGAWHPGHSGAGIYNPKTGKSLSRIHMQWLGRTVAVYDLGKKEPYRYSLLPPWTNYVDNIVFSEDMKVMTPNDLLKKRIEDL